MSKSTTTSKATMSTFFQLQEQMKDLQAKLEEARITEVTEVVADMKQKIAAYGITAADLGFTVYTPTPKAASPASDKVDGRKVEVPPKYRNPNGLETWTGRGRQPKWVAAHVEAGGKLEELLIQK